MSRLKVFAIAGLARHRAVRRCPRRGCAAVASAAGSESSGLRRGISVRLVSARRSRIPHERSRRRRRRRSESSRPATTIDDRFTVGGGGGYKSGWFRMDVTIDYAPRASYHVSHARLPHEGRDDHALANLYLDLGTWSGITPYVGAGAGLSWNRTSDYFSNALLLPGIAGMKEAKWDFAWAAMGGMTSISRPTC